MNFGYGRSQSKKELKEQKLQLMEAGCDKVHLFVLGITLSWVIKYPDIVEAHAIITSNPAPHVVIARSEGRIKLLQVNGAKVGANELLAYIESNANPFDVLKLDSLIPTHPRKDKEINNLVLGDIQQYYTNYSEANQSLRNFVNLKLYSIQIRQFNKQIEGLKLLRSNLIEQNKLGKIKLTIAALDHSRDSLLFKQSVISEKDFQLSKSKYLQETSLYWDSKSTVLNNRIQIEDLENKKTEVFIKYADDSIKLSLSIENRIKELKVSITRWKDTYLFYSKQPGQLIFLNVLKENSFVLEISLPLPSVSTLP